MAYEVPRTLVNRGGVSYDAEKTSVIFAEDMNKLKNNDAYLKAAFEAIPVSPVDGWTPANETWTYFSASVITVPTGATARYTKGDKIKITQTTVKYFYIIGVTDTTITIAVNTDYTLTSATITNNFYSHQNSPLGFPTWFNFQTNWSGDAGSAGSYTQSVFSSQFKIDGSSCMVQVDTKVTNKGSWSGTVQITVPVPYLGSGRHIFAGTECPDGVNPYTASKGLPNITGADKVVFWKTIGVANLSWSDVTVNDQAFIHGSYTY